MLLIMIKEVLIVYVYTPTLFQAGVDRVKVVFYPFILVKGFYPLTSPKAPFTVIPAAAMNNARVIIAVLDVGITSVFTVE
jgi:hypothetical protein